MELVLYSVLTHITISWAETHEEGLQKLGSTLVFNLHRMRFIQLLLSGNAIDAINYGRTHFNSFGEKHLSGILYIYNRDLHRVYQRTL